MQAFRREDGLYDIEGHIVDQKPFESTAPFGAMTPAGKSIHEMWVRLTMDREFTIRDVSAATDAGPYRACFGAPATLSVLIGTRIGGGWTKVVREKLGAVRSCTHLMEMLSPMATAAYQAMWTELRDQPEATDETGRPRLLNTCWAMSSDRALAFRRWPSHYTGPRQPSE